MSNHSGLESRLEYSKIIQSSYGSPSTIRGFRSINAGRTFSSLETSRSPGPTTLGVVQPRHSRSASECRPVAQQELEGRLRTVSTLTTRSKAGQVWTVVQHGQQCLRVE